MKRLVKKVRFDFCFRRWANKPYAVFNSLHKVIKIGVLSVCYSLITLTSENVFAHTDSIRVGKTVFLDEASVTAERRRTLSETGRVVTVITREEIETSGVNSLNDLFRLVPGFDVRSRGGNGVQADISIRGGSFDQVLILLNGVNITDPQTGHHNANIPVNLSEIDRVEVLEGSGARGHGPGAFSGAINIVTGERRDTELRFQIEGGQHAFMGQSASANLSKKRLSLYSSVSHSQSAGYVQATDFNIDNYFLQMRYQTEKFGRFGVQTSWQNKSFGANSFYSPAFRNQFEHIHAGLLTVDWNKSFDRFELQAYSSWRRHYDRYELIRDSSYGRNFHRTDVPGGQFRVNYYSKLGRTSAGGGFREEKVVSTVLGFDLERPFEVDFAKSGVSAQYTKGANRTSFYGFIEQLLWFEKLSISADIQSFYNSDFGNRFTGGLNAERRFDDKWKLKAGINSAVRLPSFTELFYRGAGYVPPSSPLSPEKSISFELGAQYGEIANISLFHRRGRDMIDWIKSVQEDPWTSANITEINSLGAEGSILWRPKNSKSFINRIQFSGLWQI
ncbi:MAG: TonB-dependent receptor plug domain-containing protein, partial [Prevotellaceae bacterium]|nr:TonB-dependent receptor plug domain-containing protein [Prevotellaceae bacterium]